MLRLKDNESGIVLLTVLMVVLTMMILAIGIFSQGITQTAFSQNQIENIRSYELAQGWAARVYTDLTASGSTSVGHFTEFIDSKMYKADIDAPALTNVPIQYNITVTPPQNSL